MNETFNCEMGPGLFKNVINKICLEIIRLIYIYKKDFALYDQQGLICHKTKAKPVKHQSLENNNETYSKHKDSSSVKLVRLFIR